MKGSDKAAAQLVPLLGAASGAVANVLFMQHFQDIARSHFIVRRLEREERKALPAPREALAYG